DRHERRRDDQGARADAVMTGVAVGTCALVVARAPVGFRRVRATPRRWVAGSRIVALIQRDAGHGQPGRTDSLLAGGGSCAAVTTTAQGAVGLRGTRASAGRRVAYSDVVTLVE